VVILPKLMNRNLPFDEVVGVEQLAEPLGGCSVLLWLCWSGMSLLRCCHTQQVIIVTVK
jgi:hypothetical protein